MTSATKAARSGSYGSLAAAAGVASSLPIKSAPAFGRCNSRASIGQREKEGILRWARRAVLRRRVGMFFLLFVSVAAFLSSLSPFLRGYEGNITVNTISVYMVRPESNIIETQPIPFHHHMNIPTHHPCEDFSFPPPPPPDKKRTGPRPCPVCYAPVDDAINLMPTSPSISPILETLHYVVEEDFVDNEQEGGSAFGGHPSLQQRNDSFDIKQLMNVYCGFVKGKKPGQGTGFDIDDADLLEMEQCHGIVVASAIFGNYDIMQQPKNIHEATKRSACFYMFVDEETEAYVKNSSTVDETKRGGLWRRIVVRNLPYTDPRRNGKVPKLLLHRLFPNAQFSIWVDGKLELIVDPYQILERFLWRENASFAISRHYKRFDVFEEGEANKGAGKYDNASIDNQLNFYKREGLTPYSPAKVPITSDVPEGCVIIREHIPITNLFTCLWFNEVDRFTSRDQLSFSTVRDKLMAKVGWSVNMFLDCERRTFVNQVYHKDLLEQMSYPPPPVLTKELPRKPMPEQSARVRVKKLPVKHGKDKRSRHRRPRVADG